MKRRFQSLAYESKRDTEYFKRGLDTSVSHWSGDHSGCTHQELTKRSYKPLDKDSEDVRALLDLFEEVKNQTSKFASGTSSNICEAMNNQITVYAPKRYNLRESNDWRVCLALLKHNEGPDVLIEIIKLLNLLVPTRAVLQQVKKEKRKLFFRKRRLEATTKIKRVIAKENKKKRGKKVVSEEHTYKGGTTLEDEDNGESLIREPKAKRVQKETDHCGCKSEGMCSNKKCSCVSGDRKCNDKCGCKDKCHNK